MSKATRQKQRLWLLIAFIIVFFAASQYQPNTESTQSKAEVSIAELYQQRKSDVQIEVTATVSRLLVDDNEGSRHQRFIVELTDGQTLLVAHNIDLAPRLNNLNVGDEVTIFGEYEWNNKGGVMHWTHHDPANRHPHGWIRHQGQLYQ